MLHTLPSASSGDRLRSSFSQLGNIDERDSDLEPFSPITSPISISSSLLALSPLSASITLDPPTSPRDTNLTPTVTPSAPATHSNPSTPLSINVLPLPSTCSTCGSSIVSPNRLTVALYSVAVSMPPNTRSSHPTKGRAQPAQNSTPVAPSDPAPPVATAQVPKSTSTRKRKAATIDDEASSSNGVHPPASASTNSLAVTADTIAAPPSAPEPVPAPPLPVPVESQPKSKAKSTARAKANKAPAQPTASIPEPQQDADMEVAPPIPTLAVTTGQPAVEAPPVPEANASPDTASTLGKASRTFEDLEKENRSLKKFKHLYLRAQGQPHPGNPSSAPDNSIPRPSGERGKNGWNMQTAMKLEHDGDQYNAILATMREAVRQSGLDWKLKFDEQDPARVGACYAQMKRAHPYLKAFSHDWACRELVIGFLQNRRKAENARVKALVVGPGKKKLVPSKRTGFKPRSKTVDPESGAGPSGSASTSTEPTVEEQLSS